MMLERQGLFQPKPRYRGKLPRMSSWSPPFAAAFFVGAISGALDYTDLGCVLYSMSHVKELSVFSLSEKSEKVENT